MDRLTLTLTLTGMRIHWGGPTVERVATFIGNNRCTSQGPLNTPFRRVQLKFTRPLQQRDERSSAPNLARSYPSRDVILKAKAKSKACGVKINKKINYYVTCGQRWIRKAWSACEAVYLECICTWYGMSDGAARGGGKRGGQNIL